MLSALAGLAASATPTPTMTVDPESVTPGPIGFAVIAVLALAVVALIWDMLRRIRRGRYRAEVNEELDAEERAGHAAEERSVGASDPQTGDAGAAGDDGDVDPDRDAPRR